MDRRRAPRFQLRLAVALSWKDHVGVVSSTMGRSRDINSRGIYIQSESPPPVGAFIEMDVFLSGPGPPTRPVKLHAEGRVVRIDPSVSPIPGGFAAVNQTVVLHDSKGRVVDEQVCWDIEPSGGKDN